MTRHELNQYLKPPQYVPISIKNVKVGMVIKRKSWLDNEAEEVTHIAEKHFVMEDDERYPKILGTDETTWELKLW
jgi:hypothetical protein